MNRINSLLWLQPYKAITLNSIRTRNNYYILVKTIQNEVLFQISAGQCQLDIKNRFNKIIVTKLHSLVVEYLLRKYVNKKIFLIIKLNNFNYSMNWLVDQLKQLNIPLLWINEKRQIAYNGCKLPNPRRK